MKVWTIQMARWRVAKEREIPFLDTTVKTGDSIFAPTWSIVMGVKRKQITQEDYRREYLNILRASWLTHRSEWEDLLAMDEVAIACFCPQDTFCHRYLLVEVIEKLCLQRGLAFTYEGELQ